METTNRKSIVQPKVWNAKDTYLDFATKLLQSNPDYWSKFSKKRKMRHFWIYTTVNNKLVEVINFDRWKNIIHAYFMSARTHITNGEALNMNNYIGKILPKCVERNHSNQKVNFSETAKRPKVWSDKYQKMVPDVIVYFTDDEWVRIGWKKTKKLANETVYKFSACSGDKYLAGFVEQFSQANTKDPLLKLSYEYHPYIDKSRSQKVA